MTVDRLRDVHGFSIDRVADAAGTDPVPASAVEQIVKAVEPLGYDRVYGAFWDTVIERNGKAAVRRSAQRYLRAIGRGG